MQGAKEHLRYMFGNARVNQVTLSSSRQSIDLLMTVHNVVLILTSMQGTQFWSSSQQNSAHHSQGAAEAGLQRRPFNQANGTTSGKVRALRAKMQNQSKQGYAAQAENQANTQRLNAEPLFESFEDFVKRTDNKGNKDPAISRRASPDTFEQARGGYNQTPYSNGSLASKSPSVLRANTGTVQKRMQALQNGRPQQKAQRTPQSTSVAPQTRASPPKRAKTKRTAAKYQTATLATSKATPPKVQMAKSRTQAPERQELQDAMEMTDDADYAMSSGVFMRRMLAQGAYGIKLLEQLVAQGGPNSIRPAQTELQQGAKAHARNQEGNCAGNIATSLGKHSSYYPYPSQIDEEIACYFGTSNIQQAIKDQTLEVINRLRGMVKEKLLRTVRFKTSERIKAAFLWALLEGESELGSTDAEGRRTADPAELEALIDDNAYRLGKLAAAEGDASSPYGGLGFHHLAKEVFPEDMPSDWEPGSNLDWLGMGQLAFLDAELQWMLKGNKELPLPSHKTKSKEWEALYFDRLDFLSSLPVDAIPNLSLRSKAAVRASLGITSSVNEVIELK